VREACSHTTLVCLEIGIVRSKRSSRRFFLISVAALAATVRLRTSASAARTPLAPRLSPQQAGSPVDRAYAFLDAMMDRYERGSSPRVVQSFVPTKELDLGDISYTYDDTLVIIALLQRGTADDMRRARVLGDGLLYAQAHDPYGDGRLRNGYHCNPFLKANGAPRIAFSDGDGGSDCGNMAWTGLALAHLYAATNDSTYLDGALALGAWIEHNAYDTRGAGGYTGGITQSQKRIAYKATEHNIDLYAFFTMLAALRGDSSWTSRAAHALAFVDAMWSGNAGLFWTGTTDDGITINKTFIPEDVQSWSYLATGDAHYASSLDWAYGALHVHAGPYVGVSFSNSDLSGVWFEGTAHLAAALLARNAVGDAGKAADFLASLGAAQAKAPNHDDAGIDAASKNGLRTGDGDKYYAALHIGATSWYCLAAQGGNPFRIAG
jgi:hypothetical protein